MTYPPQQPGPYGQGGPGQPPSGGFPGQRPPGYGPPPGGPQHGGPPPQYGQGQYGQEYGQGQYGGTAQFGQPDPYGPGGGFGDPYGQRPGGFGQEPPKKSKTGLIIGLVVAVLAVAALGITGFVAPGFFLGDDEDQQATNVGNSSQTSQQPAPSGASGIPKPSIQPGPASSAPPGEPSSAPGGSSNPAEAAAVKDVAEDAASAFNDRDTDGLKEVSCDPSKINEEDMKQIPPDAKMEIVGEPTVTGETAKVKATFTAKGKSQTDDLDLKKQDGRWCIGD